MAERSAETENVRDQLYDAWVERNAYTTTLLYSAFIAVLLPAFHYVLQAIPGVPYDSLPLRLVCTLYACAVAAIVLAFPKSRGHAERLQFVQVVATLFIIDMLVVDSRDQYLYIASALLVTIAVQNAFFRIRAIAIAMSAGFLFMVLYSAMRGILWEPYNLTTMAIFLTGYVLAFIPASMHIRSRQSDIRSRMQAIQATMELEEAHAVTHLGKWSVDLETGSVHCSAELMRILGLPLDTPEDSIVQRYYRAIYPDDVALVEAGFERYDAQGEFRFDHRIVRDGEIRWVQLSGKQECDESGKPVRRLGILIDITARKEAEVSLERLARYDPLTGLPNRTALADELAQTLERHAARGKRCAVLFLDLDRFKDINDTLGHSIGDLLLREVATRIRSLLPAGTLVARWGGDEFVALVHDVEQEGSVERTCARIIQGLSTPFAVDSYEFAVTASVGAALYPQDGTTPELLVRNADTAMYAAKEMPSQRYALFAPVMHRATARRHQIQNQLQNAVENGSLSLHYQPIVDTATGRIAGAEALLRWTDPQGIVHRPVDFITIAEETGAIIPIGMWVVRQAARQAAAWERTGLPLIVSVNISPRQLMHPDFAQDLERMVAESGLNPSLLELEITESGLVPNAAGVVGLLERVRDMGIRIAVDDFGTGYSAFSYLKQLALHTLKIDRSFVDGIEREVDRAVAESIVSIAHKLGLSVTAEGVETALQQRILAELGCDRLQGFHICRALPVEAFEAYCVQPDREKLPTVR